MKKTFLLLTMICLATMQQTAWSFTMQLDKDSIFMHENDTALVRCIISGLEDQALLKQVVTWKSSNNNVAFINTTGKLLPMNSAKDRYYCNAYINSKSAGYALISAQFAQSSAISNLTVQKSEVEDPTATTYFKITPANINLKVGQSIKTKIATNLKMEMDSGVMEYNIINKKIAKVSQDGVVTGINNGETLLVANFMSYSDTAWVTVISDSIPNDSLPNDTLPNEVVIEKTMALGESIALAKLFPKVTINMRMQIETNDVIALDLAMNVYALNQGTAKILFYSPTNKLIFNGLITVKKQQNEGNKIKKVYMVDKKQVAIEFNTDIITKRDALLKYMVKIQVNKKDSTTVLKSGEMISVEDAWITEDMRTLMVVLSREIENNESISISCDDVLVSSYDEDVNFAVVVGKEGIANNVTDTKSLNINLYPNPVRDVLHVKSDKNIKTVRIYNFNGVLQHVIDGNTINSGIDISTLTQGMYYLKAEDVNGNSTTAKFMKQ